MSFHDGQPTDPIPRTNELPKDELGILYQSMGTTVSSSAESEALPYVAEDVDADSTASQLRLPIDVALITTIFHDSQPRINIAPDASYLRYVAYLSNGQPKTKVELVYRTRVVHADQNVILNDVSYVISQAYNEDYEGLVIEQPSMEYPHIEFPIDQATGQAVGKVVVVPAEKRKLTYGDSDKLREIISRIG